MGWMGSARGIKKEPLHNDALRTDGFCTSFLLGRGKKQEDKKVRLVNSHLNNTCLRCNDFQLHHHGNIFVF